MEKLYEYHNITYSYQIRIESDNELGYTIIESENNYDSKSLNSVHNFVKKLIKGNKNRKIWIVKITEEYVGFYHSDGIDKFSQFIKK